MCILCVIQKWSRRVATMLPWLVIPLIGLWALSQLLPPAFRFEITSPRLACVFVLLLTLFWYEILMPQLSAWRVRRNARLRERKRSEAIELQKLRKMATRRCRNCLTPYRDQKPGGGRFMCSYCGHISKRPVLDLPVLSELGMSHTGIIKDLVGKSGKMLNGKVWSDNGWICGQDWLENGNWRVGSVASKSDSWRKNGNGLFGGDDHCLTESSYSGALIFACKLLTSFLLSIRWLGRKILRVSSSREECSSDAERRGVSAKRVDNGANLHESRGERARRKAEEKRQARLEKELLEEEERKQREEVARLVEERRRLRDEKMEAEKDHGKQSVATKERDRKKEAEKRRQERRKEKDKGSSKSNSDAEELEKRAGKEIERKRDLDKSETDRRENQKFVLESFKGQSADNGYGVKNNYNRGNTGTRYLDRMRGTLISSSKAFSFGRGASTTNVMKENKVNTSLDHGHSSANRRDLCPLDRASTKQYSNGDDKNINRSVIPYPQPWTAPKKSWQQLFSRTSPVQQTSNASVIARPNSKLQSEVHSPQISGQPSPNQSFDNPINFGLPSPFNLSTYPSVSTTSSSLVFSSAIEPIFPCTGETAHEFIPEEQELFEDPCYVPDPVSLLGPVSESLDNFQLDLGTVFVTNAELERPKSVKNLSIGSEIRPSPIESPISRERHNNSSRLPSTPNAQEVENIHADDAAAIEKGTWQMWNTSPLSGNWLLTSDQNISNKDDFVHSTSQKTLASLFNKDDHVFSGSCSPQSVFTSNGKNGGPFSPIAGSSDHDPWLQGALFPPLSGNDNNFSLKPQEGGTQNDMSYGSPTRSASNHPYKNSLGDCWSKKEWPRHVSGETMGTSSIVRPHVGSLYPNPDVQSLWSFD